MIYEKKTLEIKPLTVIEIKNVKFLAIRQCNTKKYYLVNVNSGEIEGKISVQTILENIRSEKYKQLGQVTQITYEYECK